MADETSDDIVPIDADVRSVLEEFSRDPIAMATEIVLLRSERLNVVRPPGEIILREPQKPPDAPPPTRLVDRIDDQ